MTVADYSGLSKVPPKKALMRRLKSHAGRNSQGRITMRHQGGGNKKLYRLVDFKQLEMNRPAKVVSVEYDPYRTAFIALVRREDGKPFDTASADAKAVADKQGRESYILAPHGLKAGDSVVTSESAPLKVGNRMRLRNIPIGYQVYNVELRAGVGGKLARSAGSYLEVLANADGYTDLKMPSGEIRRVQWDCFASLGQVSNPENNLVTIGKAGRSRWLGIRPTVRGKAMNPVDHPYGGGEGRTQRGTRKPKTKWGKITGGHRTRNRKKWSNRLIIKRRK